MAVWSIKKVFAEIKKFSDESDREISNLASWIWEDGMKFSTQEAIELNPDEEKRIAEILRRMQSGEPIQYILGHAWFYGLKMIVDSSVLIPRPETEELVNWVLEDNQKTGKSLRILDIGTGSGCIAIALKHVLKNTAHVVGVDISWNALEVAKKNALLLATEIEFARVDFLNDNLKDLGLFDIIVSNPPYISKRMEEGKVTESLSFEPELALYPVNEDTDIFYKRIAEVVPELLSSGGVCYLEMNEFRTHEIERCFHQNHWKFVETKRDMQGKLRMIKIVKS